MKQTSLFRARRRPAGKRAFTLIETTLTTIIVGLAITALIKQVLATTQENRYTLRLTTGCLLAENVREMLAGVPFADPMNGVSGFGPDAGETFATYNDIDDFDGFDSTVRPDITGGAPIGPIDAQRRVITETVGGVTQVPAEWKNWRQQIKVEPVYPDNLNVVQSAAVWPLRNCVRITATISYLPPGTATWETVVQLRWVKTR